MARLLLDRRRRVYTSKSQVMHTDLCLLIRSSEAEAVAVFGEVEANHGERLRRPLFWANKSPYAVFGAGVISNSAEGASLEVVELSDLGPRVLLLFGTRNNVMADFGDALDFLELLLQNGPTTVNPRLLPAGMREVAIFIANSWKLPVTDLIEQLGPRIANTEVNTLSVSPEIQFITTPRVIDLDI